ncbi:voltage-gated sodium channel [Zhengella mangrovi]|uniref:Voltage-gated sodium channel n=1 Tax=Zhengella mangrovi TaxID=1982044 RepID=A0A2G1QI96_9HYPH|nr:ion transporter [Zhengella mangrovi]PHP65267.1 voltage-gated sodium channel [Zhengella mangrovi]
MQVLERLVRSQRFEMAIIALIVINAITLGLETTVVAGSGMETVLYAIDRVLLVVFTVELAARALVFRSRFFHDPWRIFDLLVVGIAWIPSTGGLSVLRALRILRVLRLISVVPSLRRVIGGLLAALPGMGSILALIMLIFYVFSVMATKLFGSQFPEWFGSIGASAYSLFQIMTLESWSMGIVRPVMEVYPLAWLFFIPFIVVTTFTVLNLFIGIIVSAMQAEHEETAARDREELHNDQTAIMGELQALRREIEALRRQA